MIEVPKNGDSPSGKAVGSGPTIRGFESLIPSHISRFASKRSLASGSFGVNSSKFLGTRRFDSRRPTSLFFILLSLRIIANYSASSNAASIIQ